jgi:hypothetical protein
MGVPINNVTRRVVYAASGTGPYNFTFEILAAGDIAVYRDDTLLTLTTNYTVTINANGTGSVTLTATPTGATQIAIVGNRTIQRTTDFVTGGDFFANTLNDELDQQTIFNQQNAEGLQRALVAPQTDPTTIDMTLPRATDRANKTLAFDANGDPTLGISAADVANAVTYATNAANSATAAASSASAASTSATNAASSASSASTSATNASNSASAASTSASNASTSASSASTSASNASTSATNASNSASAASTSATNASNSATAASTSASSAASAQSAAESARDATLAAYDSFDDRYLGTKTSNPTLDNDGNALVAGALYYRSTSPIGMKVYTGSQWVDAYADGNSFVAKAGDTMTGGLTVPSLTDSGNLTFTGTGNRITGDFSNATVANRVSFQTSTVNGATSVYILPNGTSPTSQFVAVNNSDPTNASVLQLQVNATDYQIRGGITGTGTYLPMTFYTGGSERMRVDTSGNVGIGTSSPSSYGLLTLQKYSTSAPPYLVFNNRGANTTDASTYTQGGILFTGYRDTNDPAYIASITVSRTSQSGGASSAGDLVFGTITTPTGSIPTERMRIDSSGNVGIGVTPTVNLDVRNGGGNCIISAQYGTGTKGQLNAGANEVNLKAFNGTNDILTFTTGASERMRIDSSGNLLVGTTSSEFSAKQFIVSAFNGLAVRTTAAANEYEALVCSRNGNSGKVATWWYNASTQVGNISVTASATAYNTSSDYRLKNTIAPMTGALEKVALLKPCTYKWNADGSDGQGFIAHELAEVCPDAVTGEKDAVNEDGSIKPQGIDTSFLVATLTAGLQEAVVMIEELKAEVAALKGA